MRFFQDFYAWQVIRFEHNPRNGINLNLRNTKIRFEKARSQSGVFHSWSSAELQHQSSPGQPAAWGCRQVAYRWWSQALCIGFPPHRWRNGFCSGISAVLLQFHTQPSRNAIWWNSPPLELYNKNVLPESIDYYYQLSTHCIMIFWFLLIFILKVRLTLKLIYCSNRRWPLTKEIF